MAGKHRAGGRAKRSTSLGGSHKSRKHAVGTRRRNRLGARGRWG